MIAYILTLVIFSSSGSAPAITAIEYTSLDNCMTAAKLARENLTSGKVALASCTKK